MINLKKTPQIVSRNIEVKGIMSITINSPIVRLLQKEMENRRHESEPKFVLPASSESAAMCTGDPRVRQVCIQTMGEIYGTLQVLENILKKTSPNEIKDNPRLAALVEHMLDSLEVNINVVLRNCGGVVPPEKMEELRELKEALKGLRGQIRGNNFQNFVETVGQVLEGGARLTRDILLAVGAGAAAVLQAPLRLLPRH